MRSDFDNGKIGWLYAFIAVALMFVVLICAGCSRKIYVPQEHIVTRTDTLREYRLRVDSVILRDSVSLIQRGDTVLLTKYRDRFRYIDRTDTVYQAVTDSVKINVPYPVERKLTRWEQAKQDVGGMAIGGMAIALCIAVVWLVRKYRK